MSNMCMYLDPFYNYVLHVHVITMLGSQSFFNEDVLLF